MPSGNTSVSSGLGIRHPRLFGIGLPVLAVLLIANQWEHAHRQAGLRLGAQAGEVVVTAETSAAGHTSIGIAENTTGANLTFAALGQWNFQPTGGPPCPPAVMAFHGKDCAVTGFMYPLAQGDRVSVFCLLRSTQTCCFGPRPQYNQYLFVETREPVTFERLRPVQVSGRFQVDPQPGQGYIYRLEQATVTPAGAASATVDPQAFASAHGLPLWDWRVLGALAGQDRKSASLPPTLLALDHQRAVIDGYIVQRDAGPPVQIVLGLHPPQGSPNGRAPTMFDAVTVLPVPGTPLPPVWQDRMAWQGTVTVSRDPQTWDDQGIVQVTQATPCAEAAGVLVDPGPILPWGMAWVLVGGFLLITVGRRHPPVPQPV